MAQHWLEQGAERLHIVDLNGAVAGVPKNELAIREIVSVIGEEIPIQLGGGIRDLDTIESYIDAGVTFVITSYSIHYTKLYEVMPDRIETGTYLAAVAAAGGEVALTHTAPETLGATLEKLREAGAQVTVAGSGIRVRMRERPKAVSLATAPYPGFATVV